MDKLIIHKEAFFKKHHYDALTKCLLQIIFDFTNLMNAYFVYYDSWNNFYH